MTLPFLQVSRSTPSRAVPVKKMRRERERARTPSRPITSFRSPALRTGCSNTFDDDRDIVKQAMDGMSGERGWELRTFDKRTSRR